MDDAGDLLLEVYRAARETPLDQFQGVALTALKHFVRFDSAKWSRSVRCPRGVQFYAPYFYNESAESQHDYDAIESPDQVALQALTRPGWTHNFACREVHLSTEWLPYLQRWRHLHALVTGYVDGATDVVRSVALYRAQVDQPFDESERARAQAVMPHLMEAWAIAQAVELGRWVTAGSDRRWSVGLADRTGHLVFCEPEFERLMRGEWLLTARATMPRALHEHCMSHGDQVLWGRSVIFQSRPMADVFFLRARARQPVDSLTAQQLDVARHVARGETHKEIARSMHLAPATVRNHVQTILGRVGAHNNAELAAQLKSAGY
jgi:DNA-binding CsgD family transcriptional regulator